MRCTSLNRISYAQKGGCGSRPDDLDARSLYTVYPAYAKPGYVRGFERAFRVYATLFGQVVPIRARELIALWS